MSPDLNPILLSTQVAAVATLLCFLLAIPLARLRHSCRGVGWDLLDGLLLIPIALPPTVVGLVLLTLFGRHSPLGILLQDLGLEILFSPPGAVLASAVVAFPLTYQASRAAFRQVNPELIDTARTCGFTGHRLTVEIMIPLAWPGIAAGLVLTFLRAFGEFGATLMVAGNIPGVTRTAPMAIYFAVEAGDLAYAWLLAILTSTVAFALLLLSGFSNRHRDY